jgi:hypothetical protein
MTIYLFNYVNLKIPFSKMTEQKSTQIISSAFAMTCKGFDSRPMMLIGEKNGFRNDRPLFSLADDGLASSADKFLLYGFRDSF